MKAEINKNKQLLILPENGTEALGLEAWCDRFLSHGGQMGFILEPLDEGKIRPSSKMRCGEVHEST